MFRTLMGRISLTPSGLSKEKQFAVNVTSDSVEIQLTNKISLVFSKEDFFTALGAPTTTKE